MAYESKKPARQTSELPSELPDPKQEVGNGVPNGAVFLIESGKDKGRRFRLRHPETVPARWIEVLKRETKPAETK